jgi:DNA/RNA-binding domain of Phe-tRNA-synthetase-like protein
MRLEKADDPRLDPALVCLVVAEGCTVGSSPAPLTEALATLVGQRSGEEFPPAKIKDAVRDMLRSGGYKPAGRQKPASEYLAQAAREGRFPSINGPVDCNNILSLETGLPISLLDADEIGEAPLIRICAAGESYVFNASGHEMDLSGLLCACKADGTPLGNPVKDSMAGKITENTKALAGFIYAPLALYTPTSLTALGERFAELLRCHCGASSASVVAVR